MKEKQKYIDRIYYIIILLFVYQMFLLGIHITSYEGITVGMIMFAVIFILMGLLIDGSIYYIYKNVRKKLELDEELQRVYQYREQELELYQNVRMQIDRLREKRHEFSNQIQTVYIMSEQGENKEKLFKYIQKLKEHYQEEWV